MLHWSRLEQSSLLMWMSLVLFVVMVLTLIPMGAIDNSLKEAQGNHGIISFEFIFNRERAVIIMDGWGDDLVAQARKNIRLDFLFLGEYSILMALLCLIFSRRSCPSIKLWGRRFALLALLAGMFDFWENIFLLQVLSSVKTVAAWKITAASLLALCKFALVGVVLFFWLFLGGRKLVKGRTQNDCSRGEP